MAVAYQLTAVHGLTNVVLVDPRPPLTLTSDKSTECYRNWWPSEPMVGLMNRSIDLLEEMAEDSANIFGLNRRGYLFVTAKSDTAAVWERQAYDISRFGAGPVRIHPGPVPYRPISAEGFHGQPEGADILRGPALRDAFPYLSETAVAAMHIRRAGWFSAQQLGSWMLERAREAGLVQIVDEVTSITISASSVTGVTLGSGSSLACDFVVSAAGPMSRSIGEMVGLDIPLRSELHLKVAYRDHLGVVPRDAPMFIWADTQTIDWTDEEAEALLEAGRPELVAQLPIYCHGRPEGGAESPYLLALWEYHDDNREPEWPLPDDDLYPEVVMRGLTTMVPALGRYLEGLPRSYVDGGYYIKTEENRPLVGPAGPEGFVLACGYSGFGVMLAAGAADLIGAHITDTELPDYAPDFLLSRYDDPTYLDTIRAGVESGQL